MKLHASINSVSRSLTSLQKKRNLKAIDQNSPGENVIQIFQRKTCIPSDFYILLYLGKFISILKVLGTCSLLKKKKKIKLRMLSLLLFG